MTALHEVKGEEETGFVGMGRCDGDEDDGADDVDDDVSDHAEYGLSRPGPEPPGTCFSFNPLFSILCSGWIDLDSPNEKVEQPLKDGQRQTKKLRVAHAKPESLVDEKIVERI